ncbi:MAG: RDD family protein [bacterium]
MGNYREEDDKGSNLRSEGVDELKNSSSMGPAPCSQESHERPLARTGELHNSWDLVTARLGDRFIALMLDTVLLLSLAALVGMYAASRLGGITDHGFSLEGKPALVALAAMLVLGFAYHWLMEGLTGATLGKALMGLRVMGPTGRPCGLKASLVRNLLRVLDGLGLYLVGLVVAIFSKKRKRLGDHLGKTVVVEFPISGLLKASTFLLWILGTAAGIWFSYSIHSQASLAKSELQGPGPHFAEGSRESVGIKAEPLQGASLAQTSQALSVVNLELFGEDHKTQKRDGPFEPGKKLTAKFQVVGFTTDPKGEARLFFDVVALDPEGLALYENWRPTFQGSPGSPEGAIPANMELDIPVYAPSGLYKLVIKVRDDIKKNETQVVKEFSVRSPLWALPRGLEVRDFTFSGSENGPPLPKAQIQGGKRLYMAFKVAGLQFRDDRPALSIDMQVLDPEGELLLNQPGIVELRDPVRYHPATFFARITSWLDFPDETPRGVYTVRYLLHDGNSGASLTHEAKIEVK